MSFDRVAKEYTDGGPRLLRVSVLLRSEERLGGGIVGERTPRPGGGGPYLGASKLRATFFSRACGDGYVIVGDKPK